MEWGNQGVFVDDKMTWNGENRGSVGDKMTWNGEIKGFVLMTR